MSHNSKKFTAAEKHFIKKEFQLKQRIKALEETYRELKLENVNLIAACEEAQRQLQDADLEIVVLEKALQDFAGLTSEEIKEDIANRHKEMQQKEKMADIMQGAGALFGIANRY
jgi:uncharacterized protein (DUF342 family)